MSEFYISIRRHDGEHVSLKPGGTGERELVSAITTAIVSKGVGWFKSEAKVRAAIEQGIAETLHAIKAEIRP